MKTEAFLSKALRNSTESVQQMVHYEPIFGGDINATAKVTTSHATYFIKWNESTDIGIDLFEKEADGLLSLSKGPIRIPKVIGKGLVDGVPFLILEYLNKGAPTSNFWEIFGQQLAELHHLNSPHFGYHTNNHIGKLPQHNDWESDWLTFFIEHRLEFQLNLALAHRLVDAAFVDQFRKIYPQLESILPEESPALLHGDLWSGNFMIGPEGRPAIFDPAVYFGHREMELAFTHLFGGFDEKFYSSYQEAFPLNPGFSDRMDIYNLYPLLVHVNLFGSSYLHSIKQTLRRFL